jgi:hypothetical protein
VVELRMDPLRSSLDSLKQRLLGALSGFVAHEHPDLIEALPPAIQGQQCETLLLAALWTAGSSHYYPAVKLCAQTGFSHAGGLDLSTRPSGCQPEGPCFAALPALALPREGPR